MTTEEAEKRIKAKIHHIDTYINFLQKQLDSIPRRIEKWEREKSKTLATWKEIKDDLTHHTP